MNERAWGVNLAGRLHSEELNVLLVEEFRSAARLREDIQDSEGYAFLSVLFDAAIEERLRVPGELLQPYLANWTDPALMLLSWSPKNEDLLLDLRRQWGPDIIWLAANNLLLSQKSQRWYEAMLGELSISHEIVVSDLGQATGAPGYGSPGGCGDSIRKAPAGFPPVALFALGERGYPGAMLLAEGPTTIYLERSYIASDLTIMSGSCRNFGNRALMLDRYLAWLTSETLQAVQQRLHRETQLRYRGNASFEREVARLLAEQERAIRELLQAAPLQKSPVVELRIVPIIIDRRSTQAPPLPEVRARVFQSR